MQKNACRDFQVLAPHTFHPIPVSRASDFFATRSASNQKLDWSISDDIIGAHIWNSETGDLKAEKNSNQLYVQLVQSQCPLIYEIAPLSF